MGLAFPPKRIRYSSEPIDGESLRRKQDHCDLDDDQFPGLRDDAERNNEGGRPCRRMAYPE